jgi:dihydrofolate reductase
VISLVYARSRNGVIGARGGLPWRIPSDLKRFKETTLGKPVIMGRKTWDSLPRKPLPGRVNIIVSRSEMQSPEGASLAHGVTAAVALAGDVPEICVIGGGEIYTLFFDLAGRIYETIVDIDVDGDTFAPPLEPQRWQVTQVLPGLRGPNDTADFTTRILERKM